MINFLKNAAPFIENVDGYPNMLYAFVLTNSLGRLLYKLKKPDCCYIVWSNNIDHYLNLLLHDQPEFILGMGVYSGVDQDVIRMETITTNRFQNDLIETNIELKSLSINYFLKPDSNDVKLASKADNSLWNLISWKIMRLINKNLLKSKYTFLHIPKQFPSYEAASLIEQMLNR